MEKLKKYVKTFAVPLAAFGVLTTGKLSTTASAHELFFDFGGGKIVASCFDFFNKNFANLVQTIDIDQTNLAIGKSLSNAKVSFQIIKNTEWVLVVENASIDPGQFRIFLKSLTFPLKVIFKNIKGELGSPSENFATYGKIEFLSCGDLILTQSFLSKMQKKCMINGVEINVNLEKTSRDTLNNESESGFSDYDSKFWEDKDKKDEQTFCAEEPKKKEAGKKSDKTERWIFKNGGVAGALRQGVKDYKEIKKLVSEKKDIWSAINGVAQILKIKELGYKPEQGEK